MNPQVLPKIYSQSNIGKREKNFYVSPPTKHSPSFSIQVGIGSFLSSLILLDLFWFEIGICNVSDDLFGLDHIQLYRQFLWIIHCPYFVTKFFLQ